MSNRKWLVYALVSVSLAQAACSTTQQPRSEAPAGPVRVVYVDPEKFTDVGDRYLTAEESRRVYLSELQSYIVRQAAARLKQNEQLIVTISDIDMAGSFEPGRRYDMYGRIIRDVYPPRIDLSFTLTGAEGVTLKSGQRQLRDPTFLMPTAHPRTDRAALREEAARRLAGSRVQRGIAAFVAAHVA